MARSLSSAHCYVSWSRLIAERLADHPTRHSQEQSRRPNMKIVVIGGTGFIGSKTVERLRKKGHEVIAASPNSGVNTITGEGLANALINTQVVVDLANSPSFEE